MKRNRKKTVFNKTSSLLLVLLILLVSISSYLVSQKTASTSSAEKLKNHALIPDELSRDKFEAYVKDVTGEFEDTKEAPVWEGAALDVLPSVVTNSDERVLGQSVTAEDGSEKWIKISLAEKKLWAMEGDRVVYEIPISSGRPGYPTVKGEFRVWRKTRYQRYLSRNPNNPYNLPNVPCSLFFYKGFAIHGAYWHDDFGIKNRSSGCVNVSTTNACTIYDWAGPDTGGKGAINSSSENPGVRVVVY